MEVSPDNVGHCWITTGLGAEGIITDGEAGEICRTRIIPRLRELNHESAVAAGIEAIVEEMRRDGGLAARNAVSETAQDAAGSVRRTRNALVGALVVGGGLLGALLLAAALWWRRHGPKTCTKCSRRMHRLAEDLDDASLDEAQRLEERIGSVDYDVWECACGEQMVRRRDALFSKYHKCPACNARAAKTERRVITPPTYVSTGMAEDTERCAHCKRTNVTTAVLPRKRPPSEGRSGGSGGGRSGGGGSRSFGGPGRTSGGGGGGRY